MSTIENLLLRTQDITFIAQAVDNAIHAKGLIEMLDGPAATISLKIANNIVSPKIPDSLKNESHEVMDEIMSKDYDNAVSSLSEYLSQQIDTKVLDDASEAQIINGILSFVVGLLNLPK